MENYCIKKDEYCEMANSLGICHLSMKENITDNEKKEIDEMAEDIKKARKCYNLSCCDCEGFLYCEVDASGEKCDTQKNSEEIAKALREFGYRKQSETITFYKDPNIKDWAESEYAWCERPCDSNMSMLAIDKKGSIVGYASEHYWTWCDVKEVKKVSAIEFMRHFASKQSETVKEFAGKLKDYLKHSIFRTKGEDCKESVYEIIERVAGKYGVEVSDVKD